VHQIIPAIADEVRISSAVLDTIELDLAADCLQLALEAGVLRLLRCICELRDDDGGENAQDDDDDQNFDEREGSLDLRTHVTLLLKIVLPWLLAGRGLAPGSIRSRLAIHCWYPR